MKETNNLELHSLTDTLGTPENRLALLYFCFCFYFKKTLEILSSWGVVIDNYIPVLMIRENQQLVTDEPVEFEEKPVEVDDCRKITGHFRGIHRIYPKFYKGKPEDVNM